MSYLAFRERSGREALVAGPAFRTAEALAEQALLAELGRPEYARLRDALGLPSPFHGEAFRAEARKLLRGDLAAAGHRSTVFSVAQNVLCQQHPTAGVMCWLYNMAADHGWVAAGHRAAIAGEIQAALDAGTAIRHAGDQHKQPLTVGELTLPAGDRGGWEEAIEFLRGGDGDVVTTASVGDTVFPSQEIAERAPGWHPLGDADDYDGDGDDDYWAEASAATWDALDEREQWDACMPALRAAPGLEWKPGGPYRFGPLTLDRSTGLVTAL